MMRPALLLPLALLTGCVDFIDPSGVRLAEDTRISVDLSLSDARGARCDADSVSVVSPPGVATLCVDATVRLGRDDTGERDRLAQDTLIAMGVPIPPTVGEDSTYRYAAAFRLPLSVLDDTVYTVTFPRVEGVNVSLTGIRWVAAEPLGPDTIVRAPGEGIQLRLGLPRRESLPPPNFRSWQVVVGGTGASSQYNGSGVPRALYDFPAPVLAGLGGDRFVAAFNWRQSYSQGLDAERLRFNVSFVQNYAWTVRTGG